MILATEAWPAVFGGLIPIIGLAAAGYLIYRAVKNGDDDEQDEYGTAPTRTLSRLFERSRRQRGVRVGMKRLVLFRRLPRRTTAARSRKS